jgi:hypothetical protein
MLTITHKQLQAMESEVELQNIDNLIYVLKNDYTYLYDLKKENEWKGFIKEKIALANTWEIRSIENQFLVVLATLEYPNHFSGDIPGWINDIMEWPERPENDKLVLLFKELIKKSENAA